jgi:hypothetical protein
LNFQLLEFSKLSGKNLQILLAIFNFLGKCNLRCVDERSLVSCLEKAMGIVMAQLQLLSGDEWRAQ